MSLSIGSRAACDAGLSRAIPGITRRKGKPLERIMMTANYLEDSIAYEQLVLSIILK